MAQTQIRIVNAQVHCVEETAALDTYIAPAGDGTGMFLAEEAVFSYDTQDYDPNWLRGDFLRGDSSPGAVSASLALKIPIHGGGAAGTVPEFGEALKACGLRQSITSGVSVAYYPFRLFDAATDAGPPATENPGQSYSFSVIEDGIRYAMAGAFGNWAINASVGEPGMLNLTYKGSFQAVAADALEAPTYDTTVAPAFMGGAFAVNFGGAYTPIGVTSFALDAGNQVSLGKDFNKTYGYYGARITSRRSSGSFNPEMVAVASHDYYGISRAGTTGTITTGPVGGTAGDIWTLAIARAQYGMPTPEDREGIRGLSVPYKVTSAATDVEGTNPDITLTFT